MVSTHQSADTSQRKRHPDRKAEIGERPDRLMHGPFRPNDLYEKLIGVISRVKR